jgi:hypothetical protein
MGSDACILAEDQELKNGNGNQKRLPNSGISASRLPAISEYCLVNGFGQIADPLMGVAAFLTRASRAEPQGFIHSMT